MRGRDDEARTGGGTDGTRRITATHLYDFVVCEHRVALDFTLDRSLRTPPDEALSLLSRRGREVEERIARDLGYEIVRPDPADPEAGFRRTLELMKAGAIGVYQGVLLSDRWLAIPDLLRRIEGASDFGPFHYIPGDIKSGLKPRTDQVLQVVFAARLLEGIQSRRPETGFLLLGDGTESRFAIEDVADSAGLALSALEEIADGARESVPMLCAGCARCRWRGRCLPGLESGPDASFVAGMTRTRKRILARHGIRTVADVAGLDRSRRRALASEGVPTDGLAALNEQARALLEGRALSRGRARKRPLPGEGLREHFLLAEWDPLGGGEPFLFGFGSRPPGGGPLDMEEVLVADGDPQRGEVLRALVARIGKGDHAIFHYGSSARNAFERLADRFDLDPKRQGQIEGRFEDLQPHVRARAYLPVRRYVFSEVAAAISGRPLPSLAEPDDAPFVWFENHRLGEPGDWKRRLEERARRDLADLAALRDHVGSGGGTGAKGR